MVSEENIEFLLKENRRYIVGTPKSMLKEFEAEDKKARDRLRQLYKKVAGVARNIDREILKNENTERGAPIWCIQLALVVSCSR